MEILPFFHRDTGTFSYLVSDPNERRAALIDPVLDYDPDAGEVGTRSADDILAAITAAGLSLDWILETHAHADHLSAAAYLKAQTGARTGVGANIAQVQKTFRDIYNLGEDFPVDGRQFDRLLTDGEQLRCGRLVIKVMLTPGHTSDSVTFVVGDAAFVGDTLFMPPRGTARCDFPGGNAGELYDSIQRILGLPADTRLYTCHDYPEAEETPRCESSIAAQRAANIHVRDGVSRESFIRMRTERDAGLAVPRLIYPSLQVNIRCGRLPDPETNGVSYLKIPLRHSLPTAAGSS